MPANDSELLEAARTNNKSMVAAILKREDVDVNARSSMVSLEDAQFTALHYAAKNNQKDILILLLQHPNIKVDPKKLY